MGRGNVCVNGEYEGLYYIDWDNYSSEYEDGTIVNDYDAQRDDYESDRESFADEFCKMFKSFSRCDDWVGRGREDHAIAKNGLFILAECDNQWSVAIKLLQIDNKDILGLQKKHFDQYFNGLKEVLFNYYDELGTYSGAWTSGRIKKP